MESSPQKTFRHQGKYNFIFAVFVFIPLIYPTFSIANHFNVVPVANGIIIRFIGKLKIHDRPNVVIIALEAPDIRNESSNSFLPGLPRTLPVRSYADLFHFYPSIPIDIDEFMGRLISPPSVIIWKWL